MNILVLGDSHSRVFKYCNKKQNKIKFNVCDVGGATCQGSVNPNSKTNALKIFKNKILNIKKKPNKIIIMLGEVDCGFLIWVRAKKYNISVDDQINLSINNLFVFIKNIIIEKLNMKQTDIIVLGSILPTIKDNLNKKYLNGARKDVTISQKERTKKTIEYNNILKKKCIENNYKYIDITKYILDINTNTINNIFLNKDPCDHHLDSKSYILWLIELNKILF